MNAQRAFRGPSPQHKPCPSPHHPRPTPNPANSPSSLLQTPPQALKELQVEGLGPNCRVPGVHDPIDPEYSILKQRLARRIRWGSGF
jgi:hypothetical protein